MEIAVALNSRLGPSADARATCVERLHRGGDRTFDKIRARRGSCRLAGRLKLDVVLVPAMYMFAGRKHAHMRRGRENTRRGRPGRTSPDRSDRALYLSKNGLNKSCLAV